MATNPNPYLSYKDFIIGMIPINAKAIDIYHQVPQKSGVPKTEANHNPSIIK